MFDKHLFFYIGFVAEPSDRDHYPLSGILVHFVIIFCKSTTLVTLDGF